MTESDRLTAPSERNGVRLWIRLWLAYTLLCFLGMSALMIISGSAVDANNYSATHTPGNLARFLEAEVEAAPWMADAHAGDPISSSALRAIVDRLMRLESPNEQQLKFRIDMVSWPEAAVRIEDGTGRLLAESRSGDVNDAEALTARSVLGRGDETRIVVASLVAPFDFSKNLSTKVFWVIEMSPMTLITSALIGLLCGIVSARYVTRRLNVIDQATARWRLGDFDTLIELHSGDELEIHAQRLNAMASELETHLNLRKALAVSDERTRIARDLHDTVKQKLFALALQLAVLRQRLAGAPSSATCLESLSEAESITRETQKDLIDIIDQLRPSRESAQSLGELLVAAADNYQRRLSTEVRVQSDRNLIVSPRIEYGLLKSLQEMVTNAVRHGKASRITIGLQNAGESATLSVEDNGIGFDPARCKRGLGLQSIQQRVAELPGGALEISSSPGAGAQLSITWSLANA